MFPMFVGLLNREQAKAKTEPTPVVPPAPPMSPRDELTLLEKKVLEKGMSPDNLAMIQGIGDCPQQVQTRISRLHEWLAAH
mgnify:CR=1 FL=1